MNRRAFLAGLAATGCARRLPPSLPSGPVTLGWRLIPGVEVSWRCLMTRRSGPIEVRRVEEWSYLVRELGRDGVAHLHGRLTGLGAQVEVHDRLLPAPSVDEPLQAERAAAPGIELRLAMDGRILSCSASGFADRLPHLLLGLRLPADSILAGDEWADAALVRPFRDLLPVRLPVTSDGRSQVVGLQGHEGQTLARIESHGWVRAPGDGPSLALRGSSAWNADRGILETRRLDVTFLPDSADPVRDPGTLRCELFLV